MSSSLLVLYASQTGNAQDVAESIQRTARRRGLPARLAALDAYDATHLPTEQCVVFVVSTTGQGEPPDNMRSFWRLLLRRSLPPTALERVQYAVFGLGDSGYVDFNVMGKKLYRRLEALGARALLPLGLGDDQHKRGYEGALVPWLNDLWGVVGGLLGGRQSENNDNDAEDEPRYVVHLTGRTLDEEFESRYAHRCAAFAEAIHAARQLATLTHAMDVGHVDPPPTPTPTSQPPPPQHYSHMNPYYATMVVNRRLTTETYPNDVRHIELAVDPTHLPYEPGHVAGLIPWTEDGVVQELCTRLHIQPNAEIQVAANTSLYPAVHASFTCSIRALLRGALDIASAPPRRYFFEVLSRFATAAHERERLAYFASGEGLEDAHAYCRRERRSVLECLLDFPSAMLPLPWLLQVTPRLQPRYFSLASSPLADPGRLHLTVAIVDYKTPWKRSRHGLCTHWLANLCPPSSPSTDDHDAVVPVWIQPGTLPLHPTAPLLLIGPGTGLAPMRSFLRHRHALRSSTGATFAPSLLFFGCRNAVGDYLYRDELESYEDGCVLQRLVVACSRDQEAKRYVQHAIMECRDAVWQLLDKEGGVVYVSGSANKMPSNVADAIKQVACSVGGLTEGEAVAWLGRLVGGKRYLVECWN